MSSSAVDVWVCDWSGLQSWNLSYVQNCKLQHESANNGRDTKNRICLQGCTSAKFKLFYSIEYFVENLLFRSFKEFREWFFPIKWLIGFDKIPEWLHDRANLSSWEEHFHSSKPRWTTGYTPDLANFWAQRSSSRTSFLWTGGSGWIRHSTRDRAKV